MKGSYLKQRIKEVIELVRLEQWNRQRIEKFSRGMKQRLGLAQALLHDPPVLILDEATSALDTESEKYIQAGLDALMENRTTLVIAHRLSTIEKADTIFVMSEGELVEQGKHAELLELNGIYAVLYRMQFNS